MKTRLDQLLVTKGLARSRTEAQALILAGRVSLAGGGVAVKPGTLVAGETAVTLKPAPRFVSRGGEKLAAALEHFRVLPAGKTAL
ncbi:MAG: S4 domain-containing protein, partial [Desulfobaccales bacterium]